MKITLQIEVDNATDVGNLVALAQLLREDNRRYTFVFDEVMPALSDVLVRIHSVLLNTPNLQASVELQKTISDPMLSVIEEEAQHD